MYPKMLSTTKIEPNVKRIFPNKINGKPSFVRNTKQTTHQVISTMEGKKVKQSQTEDHS